MDWLPNISLRREVTDDYQIEYTYNKRIIRPHMNL